MGDVQENWATEVQALWRVAHSRSSAREVSGLWTAAPHLLQHLDRTGGGANCAAPLHEDFIAGVVAAAGTLSRSLQRALVSTNSQVPEHIDPSAFVMSCADALNEMCNADQLCQVRVGGARGEAIQRLIKEEMAT